MKDNPAQYSQINNVVGLFRVSCTPAFNQQFKKLYIVRGFLKPFPERHFTNRRNNTEFAALKLLSQFEITERRIRERPNTYLMWPSNALSSSKRRILAPDFKRRIIQPIVRLGCMGESPRLPLLHFSCNNPF